MKEDQVTGPFDLAQAESELHRDAKAFIWGHGMKEWLTYSQWKDEASRSPRPSDQVAEQAQWKYKDGPDIHGPLSYNDMIFELKKIHDYENLEIWSQSLGEWKSIFMVPTVADQLGITRRRHSRVPIMGQLEAEFPSGEKQIYRVISISEGGVGLNLAKGLKLGDRFKGILTSAHLNITIHCDCHVTYIKDNGYVGVEFAPLAAEALNTIIEYVNKFEKLP